MESDIQDTDGLKNINVDGSKFKNLKIPLSNILFKDKESYFYNKLKNAIDRSNQLSFIISLFIREIILYLILIL